MTIEQKRRELFEAWYTKRYGSRENSAWAHAEFCDAWGVWCAALDAVVIELPPRGYWGGYDQECYMEAKDVEEAIESTGLGLKVKP